MAVTEAEVLIERLRTKLAEDDPENPFNDGIWVRNEKAAALLAEFDRLRRIAAAAKKLTEQLPPNCATLSLAPFRLSSYGTALLYTLRTAVEEVGDE